MVGSPNERSGSKNISARKSSDFLARNEKENYFNHTNLVGPPGIEPLQAVYENPKLSKQSAD